MNNLIGFKCTICGTEYAPHEVEYVCPKHGDEGVLDAIYDYGSIRQQIDPKKLADQQTASNLNLFRYKPLLPIDSESGELPLHIGWTPLYRAPSVEKLLGIKEVWIKDDGRNPTASFKDRASSVVVVKARELKRDLITTASSGNAGAALAGMAASIKMPAVIFVPHTAPQAKVAQLLIYGATVFLVKDNYDAAFDLCLQASKVFGWYCRNTAYNPITVEGKKTASLEICEQLSLSPSTGARQGGNWIAPDRIFVSVGDGNIISGLHAGLRDLAALGWIDRMPKLMGIQAEGSAAVYNAWRSGQTEIEPVAGRTIADSINVDLPRDGRRAVRSIRETNGEALQVSDDEILDAMRILARETAVFAEPAASAAFAGLIKAAQANRIGHDERVVVVITGSGLKDVSSAIKAAGQA
ncbi:MAG TPA: threonine synthase, partial [Anaerolineae bacterium]|nr:threonine synthase [Anaerolineae bacterium]